MINVVKVPRVPFYFIRHGQTDWNKNRQTLCHSDDIELNQVGIKQIEDACDWLSELGITQIYASPLTRAQQSAEIINHHLQVPLQFHEGLCSIIDATVVMTMAEIIIPSAVTLIVSHGEIYRILLRVLNIASMDVSAQNGGLYLFSPLAKSSDGWTVSMVYPNS